MIRKIVWSLTHSERLFVNIKVEPQKSPRKKWLCYFLIPECESVRDMYFLTK